jgi:hypothetical protein
MSLGPVAPSVTYPDGLVVRLVSLERLPAAAGASCDDNGVCRPGADPRAVVVRVNVGLALPVSAPAAVTLDVVAGTAGGISLLMGPERQAAAIDCGFVGEADVLCTDSAATVPARVEPGSEVTLSETFDVPGAELAALAVTVQPPVADGAGANPLRAVTFTGAQRQLLPR